MRIRGVKLERQSHAGSFRPYIYRDPRRCSRERLLELAAHDAHIYAIQRLWSSEAVEEKVRRHLG